MVRLLLRSCEAVQAIVLLAERGLPSTPRSLLRGLIEDGLCAAAICDQAEVFIEMLKADFNASQRRKGQFILAQDLLKDPAAKERLSATIEAFDKGQILNPKKVAELGSLLNNYLTYQWFSDESGHVTARSLNRYVLRSSDPTGWAFRWLPAVAEEIEITLYHAVLAALAVGVAATQVLGDQAGNKRLGPLADRLAALPAAKLV